MRLVRTARAKLETFASIHKTACDDVTYGLLDPANCECPVCRGRDVGCLGRADGPDRMEIVEESRDAAMKRGGER